MVIGFFDHWNRAYNTFEVHVAADESWLVLSLGYLQLYPGLFIALTLPRVAVGRTHAADEGRSPQGHLSSHALAGLRAASARASRFQPVRYDGTAVFLS